MTPEAHVEHIVSTIAAEIRDKYHRGQEAHGGMMARKAALPHAIEEVHDLEVYLITLRDQHGAAISYLGQALADRDWSAVGMALNVLTVGNPEGEPEEERES